MAFTTATLVQLEPLKNGTLRAVVEYTGDDKKAIRRAYEFGSVADNFLVLQATQAIADLNAIDAYALKVPVGTVLVTS